MKSNWIDICSQAVFVAGVVTSLGIGIWFNVRTALIVKNVQRICNKEGRDWLFWSDGETKMKFVYAPEKLIQPEDSKNILAAKQILLNHRGKMIRTAFIGAGALLMGTLLSGVVPLFIALYNQSK